LSVWEWAAKVGQTDGPTPEECLMASAIDAANDAQSLAGLEITQAFGSMHSKQLL